MFYVFQPVLDDHDGISNKQLKVATARSMLQSRVRADEKLHLVYEGTQIRFVDFICLMILLWINLKWTEIIKLFLIKAL